MRNGSPIASTDDEAPRTWADNEETLIVSSSVDDFMERPEDQIIRKESRLARLPPRRAALSPLLFLAVCLWASWQYWHHPAGERLAANGEAVYVGHEYGRLFTAVLVHADLAHFLSNAPLLFIFGWLLRAYFGGIAFPVGAFLCGALANALTVALYPPQVDLVGASGMVYAMCGMWLMGYLRFEDAYSLGLRILRATGFVLIVLVPTQFVPETSYLAHTAGFLCGALYGLLPFLRLRTIDKSENP